MKETKNTENFNKEWTEEMKQNEITTKNFNEEVSKHLQIFYNEQGILDIELFLNGAEDIVNKLFSQSWENKTFGNMNNFILFLNKIIKLHILYFNLGGYNSKKLSKSVFRFGMMYGEILEYGEEITEDTKIYLEKNRHNEQKKEEIKQLVERDYEIYFGEGAKGKMLNTKVGQATNEIIEVFSDGYYGSYIKDTTK